MKIDPLQLRFEVIPKGVSPPATIVLVNHVEEKGGTVVAHSFDLRRLFQGYRLDWEFQTAFQDALRRVLSELPVMIAKIAEEREPDEELDTP